MIDRFGNYQAARDDAIDVLVGAGHRDTDDRAALQVDDVFSLVCETHATHCARSVRVGVPMPEACASRVRNSRYVFPESRPLRIDIPRSSRSTAGENRGRASDPVDRSFRRGRRALLFDELFERVDVEELF
jgi:hypothetical protein